MSRPRKRTKARTARELDLMDLLDHLRRRDRGVADAVVEVLTRADATTLAALGTVVAFLKEEAGGPR